MFNKLVLLIILLVLLLFKLSVIPTLSDLWIDYGFTALGDTPTTLIFYVKLFTALIPLVGIVSVDLYTQATDYSAFYHARKQFARRFNRDKKNTLLEAPPRDLKKYLGINKYVSVRLKRVFIQDLRVVLVTTVGILVLCFVDNLYLKGATSFFLLLLMLFNAGAWRYLFFKVNQLWNNP